MVNVYVTVLPIMFIYNDAFSLLLYKFLALLFIDRPSNKRWRKPDRRPRTVTCELVCLCFETSFCSSQTRNSWQVVNHIFFRIIVEYIVHEVINRSSLNLLTLPVSCISESCTEVKIKLNFYFHTSFVVPQKVEGL